MFSQVIQNRCKQHRHGLNNLLQFLLIKTKYYFILSNQTNNGRNFVLELFLIIISEVKLIYDIELKEQTKTSEKVGKDDNDKMT